MYTAALLLTSVINDDDSKQNVHLKFMNQNGRQFTFIM